MIRIVATGVSAALLVLGLVGCVDTNQNGQPDTVHPQAREAAGKTAGAAVRYAGDATKNAAISGAIRTRLSRDPDIRLYRIDVAVDNGVATLTGEVNSAKESARAAAIAKEQSGVSAVKNRIKTRATK